MKRFVYALVLVVLPFVTAPASAAEQRLVFVPLNNSPFTVNQGNWVRLRAETIGGGEIRAKIQGPARIVSENSLIELSGGEVVIGVNRKEFDIKPIGRGAVRATIYITSPIPEVKPKRITYRFNVQ